MGEVQPSKPTNHRRRIHTEGGRTPTSSGLDYSTGNDGSSGRQRRHQSRGPITATDPGGQSLRLTGTAQLGSLPRGPEERNIEGRTTSTLRGPGQRHIPVLEEDDNSTGGQTGQSLLESRQRRSTLDRAQSPSQRSHRAPHHDSGPDSPPVAISSTPRLPVPRLNPAKPSPLDSPITTTHLTPTRPTIPIQTTNDH